MPKQYKASVNAFGEPKCERFQVLFTETGLHQLDQLCEHCEMSRGDLLERAVRHLAQIPDASRDILRGVADENND